MSAQQSARMSGAEVLAEVAWFLDADVHPLLIADTLGRTPDSIYMAARRHGDVRVLRAFRAYEHAHRRRSVRVAVAA